MAQAPKTEVCWIRMEVALTESIQNGNDLHEQLCLALHEGSDVAIDRLSDSAVDIHVDVPDHDTATLFGYVKKTLEVDESGDASLDAFIRECSETDLTEWSVNELLGQFLVWANGVGWKEYLDNAKPGDVPPKR